MLLKDRKVLVVGLARSGVGAARLLSLMGAQVTVTDSRAECEMIDLVSGLGPAVKLALGGHPEEIFTAADLIVVSPGVPLEISPIAAARQRGIPVIGELELAYQLVATGGGSKAPCSSPAFLAITGSNGKSTTTTLLDHMMRKSGFRTVCGGNIGNALSEELYRIATGDDTGETSHDKDSSLPGYCSFPDFFVIEASSFQLESIEGFRPHVAALLNITPDHLDRYHSLAEYRDAKANIYRNQRDNDFLVMNADDPGVMELYGRDFRTRSAERPMVCFFSRVREVEGLYLKDGKVYCSLPGRTSATYLISADAIRIKGVHNLENAMAASAMALLAGCPVEAVMESMKEFGGLEHRLELVRELDGVSYINDSKGTNVGAVIKSIESFSSPVILIAGGRDKAGDFSALRALVSQKVKAVVLIGEASGKIRDALGDVTETVIAGSLGEAVAMSRQMASKGDVVLLSPACASFDMFRDYEDRGRQFKKNVMELNNGNG